VQIFVSYAREDLITARKISASLQQYKLEPWLDVERLQPGQNWRQTIESAIKASAFFVALLSSNSVNKRGYVQKELRTALDVLQEMPPSQVYIIPVRIDECEPDYPALQDIHWTDLFPSYDEAVQRIIDAILPGRRGQKRESTSIVSLAFVSQGKCLLTHRADGTLDLCHAESSERLRQIADKVSTVAALPQMDRILYCSKDRIVLADLEPWRIHLTLKATKTVTCLGCSSDGVSIVVGYDDGTLDIWDMCGRLSGRLSGGFVGHQHGTLEGPNKARFSPDSRHIVTLSTLGNRVKVWSVQSGELLQELHGYDQIKDVALSPDGQRLAMVDVEDDINYNSTLKVLSFPGCSEVASFYDSYLLQALDFSPDGTCIAAATNDRRGVVRVYDTRSSDKWFPHRDAASTRFVTNETEIYAIAYSPDGLTLATGDSQGALTLWTV
jgi:WD40 repeat protein